MWSRSRDARMPCLTSAPDPLSTRCCAHPAQVSARLPRNRRSLRQPHRRSAALAQQSGRRAARPGATSPAYWRAAATALASARRRTQATRTRAPARAPLCWPPASHARLEEPIACLSCMQAHALAHPSVAPPGSPASPSPSTRMHHVISHHKPYAGGTGTASKRRACAGRGRHVRWSPPAAPRTAAEAVKDGRGRGATSPLRPQAPTPAHSAPPCARRRCSAYLHAVDRSADTGGRVIGQSPHTGGARKGPSAGSG